MGNFSSNSQWTLLIVTLQLEEIQVDATGEVETLQCESNQQPGKAKGTVKGGVVTSKDAASEYIMFQFRLDISY